MLGHLLLFYLEREMRLVKLQRAIRFKSSPYFASYIANNTVKRQHFKHYDVKKAFYKFINNAPNGKAIENVTRRTDICVLNDIEKSQRLAEKPHCVNFSVFDGQVAPPEQQVEAFVAEKQQLQNALVGIEIRKLNHFINKPFTNGFCVFKDSKLKMYVTYLLLL